MTTERVAAREELTRSPDAPPAQLDAPVVKRRVVRMSVAIAAALVVAVALRFVTTSEMWLDEAQTLAIAVLPIPDMLDALRMDGSPPLYYLLLHGWTALFGEGDFAVRALSGVFAVAALPVIWIVGRRLSGDRFVAWASMLLLASCPFAIRYATEARMYSLLTLLVLLGVPAVLALRRPGPLPVVGVAAMSGALALTHYWTFFLLGILGAAFGWLALRPRSEDPLRAVGWRGLAGLALGAVPFLPWLPTFVFQLQHTGAPWGGSAWFTSALAVVDGWAGGGLPGQTLGLLYWALAVLAVAGRSGTLGRLVLERPRPSVPAALALLSFGPLVVGLGLSYLGGSAYALRYSAIVVGLFMVLLAFGVRVVGPAVRWPLLAALVALGLISAGMDVANSRTQAGEVAEKLRAEGQPGDVVVVCPDQLGPALRRQLPGEELVQVAYPTLNDPARVNWVDYEQRNNAADPASFARTVTRMAGGDGRVWLVYEQGYLTFGDQCSQLRDALARRHPISVTMIESEGSVFEHENLVLYFPRRT